MRVRLDMCKLTVTDQIAADPGSNLGSGTKPTRFSNRIRSHETNVYRTNRSAVELTRYQIRTTSPTTTNHG